MCRTMEERMIVVLLNAAAGSAGAPELPDKIVAAFAAAGLEAEVVEIRAGENPAEAATREAKRASIVVAAGGDGTVSGIASGLVGTDAIMGVLPIGTLNHFAKDLKIPLTLPEAVATVGAGHAAFVDIGRVNGRAFINNASIGVYPNVVVAREELRRQGHRKWTAFALATYRVLRRYRGVWITLEIDGRRVERRTPFVFVGNNEYTIEGVHLGSRGSVADGRLFAYLAPRLHVRNLPMMLWRALFGRSKHAADFEIHSATNFSVHLRRGREIRVAADGEVLTMTAPLQFEILPGALRVLRPPA